MPPAARGASAFLIMPKLAVCFLLFLGPSLGQSAAPRTEQVRSGAHGAWLRAAPGWPCDFLAPWPVLGPKCSAPDGASPIRRSRRVASRRAGLAVRFSCTLARPWAKVQRPGRSKSDPALTARGFAPRRAGRAIFLHLGPSLGQSAAPRTEQVRSGAHGAWLRAAPGWPCDFLAPWPVLGPKCSAPGGASPIRRSRRVASRRAGLAVRFSCTLARPWAKVQRPGRSKSDPALTARGFAPRRAGRAIFLHLGPSLGQGAAPRTEQVRSGAHGAWLRAAPGWPSWPAYLKRMMLPLWRCPAGATGVIRAFTAARDMAVHASGAIFLRLL